jgi:hypothetical protein
LCFLFLVRRVVGVLEEGVDEGGELLGPVAAAGCGSPLLVGDHLRRHAPLLQLLLGVVHEEGVLPAGAQLHDPELAVVEVVEAVELGHRPLEPLHEEHPRGEAVGDDHQVGLAAGVLVQPPHVDVPPQRLQEACATYASPMGGFMCRRQWWRRRRKSRWLGSDDRTGDAVEDVGGGLALGESEEEAAEALARLLDGAHALLHLEVAEVLLPDAALLAGADDAVPREGAAHLAQRGPGARVGGHVEVDLPVAAASRHHVADAVPRGARLLDSQRCQRDAVVGRGGVGRHVQVPLALAVPHQDDALRQPPRALRMVLPRHLAEPALAAAGVFCCGGVVVDVRCRVV